MHNSMTKPLSHVDRDACPPLTHLDRRGRARMVDVGAKTPTRRTATVQCWVRLSPEAFAALTSAQVKKGDAMTVAQVAGIQAAKRTDELIPLCHALPLEHVAVSLIPDEASRAVRIVCRTATTAKTGIEMEAFVGASVAALALYDMVKAVDPSATITELALLEKAGGTQPFHRGV